MSNHKTIIMTKISNQSKIVNLLRKKISGTNVNLRFTKTGVVYAVTSLQRKKSSKKRDR